LLEHGAGAWNSVVLLCHDGCFRDGGSMAGDEEKLGLEFHV